MVVQWSGWQDDFLWWKSVSFFFQPLDTQSNVAIEMKVIHGLNNTSFLSIRLMCILLLPGFWYVNSRCEHWNIMIWPNQSCEGTLITLYPFQRGTSNLTCFGCGVSSPAFNISLSTKSEDTLVPLFHPNAYHTILLLTKELILWMVPSLKASALTG